MGALTGGERIEQDLVDIHDRGSTARAVCLERVYVLADVKETLICILRYVEYLFRQRQDGFRDEIGVGLC